MGIPFVYAWPKELTNKEWQKKKGLKDKLKKATKTGLGKMLEDAEKEWKKINWDSLDASTAMKPVDPSAKYKAIQEIAFAKAQALAELKNQVATTRKVLMKASGLARDAAKSGELSKDATVAANAISKGLLDQEQLIRTISLDDFAQKAQRFQQLFDMQVNKLDGDINNLEAAIKKVLKTPTHEQWNAEVKQRCRSVGNTLGNFDVFKAQWKVWVKFDGGQADNHPELKKGCAPERESEIIRSLLTEVASEIPKLRTALKKPG